MEFLGFIDREIGKRNWTRNQLAQKAGLSSSYFTMLSKGSRQIGADACSKIAEALKLPKETVFRAAGLLPQVSEVEELREQILAATANMSREEQREVLNYIRFRKEVSGDQSKDTPAGAKLNTTPIKP